MDNEELIKKVIEDSKRYAEKQGFKLNQDEDMIRFIAEGIAENQKNLGARFCPCRTFAGNRKEYSICPCRWHKEEIEEKGRCHCGLFVKNKGLKWL